MVLDSPNHRSRRWSYHWTNCEVLWQTLVLPAPRIIERPYLPQLAFVPAMIIPPLRAHSPDEPGAGIPHAGTTSDRPAGNLASQLDGGMSGAFSWLRQRFRPSDDGREALARLIMSAREDPAFRSRLRFVLRLPLAQREPLVRTVVEEMRLRGEPMAAQVAFLQLASDDGARTALGLLESE